MTSYTLDEWMQAVELGAAPAAQATGLALYVVSVGLCLLVVGTLYVFPAFSSLQASRSVHDQLLDSALSATLAWHDAQPSGRKINRFSQDISALDSNVMNNLADFLDCLVSTAQVLLVIAVLLPAMIPFFTPIALFNYWVSKKFIRVSRELKRLESVNRSPVFALFSETLAGLSVIRAFRHESRFFRLACQYLDVAGRCHFYTWAMNRWLNVRAQLAGAVVSGSVALAVVLEAPHLGSTVAGLVLVYAMNFTDAVTYMTRLHGECQMSMNSVERIVEYCKVEREQYQPISLGGSRAPDDTGLEMASPPLKPDWPATGSLEFKRLELKYRVSDPPVLK